MSDPRPKNEKYIAHKASNYKMPENTYESMKAMHQIGATKFEIDCFMMKDGNLAVIHDKNIAKRTTGRGKITKLCKHDLIDVYVKGGDGGQKIPMLEQLMEYTRDNDLQLSIEVKDKRVEIVDRIDALIKFYGEKHFMIYSFYSKIVQAFAKKYPNYEVQWNCEKYSIRKFNYAQKENVGINLDGRYLSKSDIEKLKELNKPIHVFTVNKKHVAEKIFSYGVDLIITDTLFEGDIDDKS